MKAAAAAVARWVAALDPGEDIQALSGPRKTPWFRDPAEEPQARAPGQSAIDAGCSTEKNSLRGDKVQQSALSTPIAPVLAETDERSVLSPLLSSSGSTVTPQGYCLPNLYLYRSVLSDRERSV